MSDLIEALDALGEELLENHPMINQGGCCVVAAHIARHLDDIGIPVRVVCSNYYNNIDNLDDWLNIDELRSDLEYPLDLREWTDAGVDFYHVYVEFDYRGETYTFDAEGVSINPDRLDGIKLDGSFTIEEATAFANTDDWNPDFNRKEIPVVRRRITKHMNKYKKAIKKKEIRRTKIEQHNTTALPAM